MKEYGDLSVKEVADRGKGVFAGRTYHKGGFILLVAGPIGAKFTHYTVPIASNLCIDPVPFNNLGMYLNHSCEPNAGIVRRTEVVAMRDILPGEEIAIDYAMIVDDYGDEITEEERVCKCGSDQCRGQFGAYNRLPGELKQRYEGFISDWLTAGEIG